MSAAEQFSSDRILELQDDASRGHDPPALVPSLNRIERPGEIELAD
ncbi:MAG: hypothetical protein ACR2RV_00870 [Verrucomicrobiales bacterium]